MNTKTNLEGIKELALGVTSEEMKALYFNNVALREPSYRLSQLNARGKRYYYTWDVEGNPIFFPSVTTILRNVMPENKFLTDWKLSLGKEASEAYTMERARYGSFIHGQLAELMISRTYDLELLRERLSKYVEKENLPLGFVDAYESEAKADIVAFAKWMYDYDVRPYAVEVALYSSRGYAGMIDLVCSLRKYARDDKKNGENNERIDAIVDFKSGKKGFYDEYAIQLELYREMWNENFPDKEIERIFNIAPKDYLKTVKKVPSYNFEEQTENPVLRKIPYLLGLFELEEEDERKVVVVGGSINLDEGELGDVSIYSLSDLVKIHHEQKVEEKIEEGEGDPFKELLGGD